MSASYRVDKAVRYLRIENIKDDPTNHDYHSEFDPGARDSALCDDIAVHGVLLPILLRPDGETICDGHRRKWASEYCGLDEIPAIVLSDDDDAVFRSAQLHRNLSIFAKCKLHRAAIESLVKRANAIKGSRNSAQDEELADDWDKLVAVLGVDRQTLMKGVRLLARIEELRASGTSKNTRLATLIETTFRNRGYRPAADLAGDPDQVADDEGSSLSPTRRRKAAKRTDDELGGRTERSEETPDPEPPTPAVLALPLQRSDPAHDLPRGVISVGNGIVRVREGNYTVKELWAMIDLLDTEERQAA